MFDVISYSYESLRDMLANKPEISQEGNFNAYSRLFIVNANTVAKLYVSCPELAEKNVHNLSLLRNRTDTEKTPGLVLPTSLIRVDDTIIGYTMPYIRGKTLDAFLRDSQISSRKKIDVFQQLAHLIQALPNDIFIGDLHGDNVMIDANNKIHLVDIDGFSVMGGHALTAPQHAPSGLRKYWGENQTQIISRCSDIFCFYHLFLTWLAGTELVTHDEYIEQYVLYLDQYGAPASLVSDIRRLYQDEPNTLDFQVTEIFCSLLENCSFEKFLQQTGLIEQERKAMDMLDKLLSKREDV